MTKTLKEMEHDGGEDYSGTFPSRVTIKEAIKKRTAPNILSRAAKKEEKQKQKKQLEYLMNDDRAWQEF